MIYRRLRAGIRRDLDIWRIRRVWTHGATPAVARAEEEGDRACKEPHPIGAVKPGQLPLALSVPSARGFGRGAIRGRGRGRGRGGGSVGTGQVTSDLDDSERVRFDELSEATGVYDLLPLEFAHIPDDEHSVDSWIRNQPTFNIVGTIASRTVYKARGWDGSNDCENEPAKLGRVVASIHEMSDIEIVSQFRDCWPWAISEVFFFENGKRDSMYGRDWFAFGSCRLTPIDRSPVMIDPKTGEWVGGEAHTHSDGGSGSGGGTGSGSGGVDDGCPPRFVYWTLTHRSDHRPNLQITIARTFPEIYQFGIPSVDLKERIREFDGGVSFADEVNARTIASDVYRIDKEKAERIAAAKRAQHRARNPQPVSVAIKPSSKRGWAALPKPVATATATVTATVTATAPKQS